MESIKGLNQTLLRKEDIRRTPSIGSTDGKGYDAVCTVHFFTPNAGWDWYMTEYDEENMLAFGLVKGFDTELGYFSLREFVDMNEDFKARPSMRKAWVERDQWWEPKPLREIRGIEVPSWAD